MRVSKRLAVVSLAAGAAVSAGLVGCRHDEPTASSQPASVSLPWRAELGDEPLYQALQAATGYSPYDLTLLRDQSVNQAVVECMAQRGFTTSIAAESPIESKLAGTNVGDVARRALELIDQNQVGPSVSRTPSDVEAQQLAACRQEVESSTPALDLLALTDDLMSGATTSAGGFVASSSDYAEAKEQLRMCIASIGLVDLTVVDEARGDDSRALDALYSFVRGEVDEQSTLAALEEIAGRRALDAPLLQQALRCEGSFLAVERALYFEGQLRYLNDHPGFIDGIAEQLEETIAGL
ncbi:MAG: hypothetical protein R2694_09940 [Ilumatobacteraceae bacterium]|nr:hypothetical protein [Actinomycetota bacterium]MCB0981367.1 hypothetical protein [Ilumatobacter sp.]MCB9382015.1 hypothetical protein [Acidimicrobiaceae bacterium]MCO5329994.1 hypothetical protein [Ilumatobacteraceae bacterium]